MSARPFAVWALIGLLVLLAGHNRFIQDDAFISFRYAQHLVAGHGLTWNIGENQPVEGYTNFLWVLLIAFAELCGLDPVTSSTILGLLFGVGTLYFTYSLTLWLLESQAMALLTVLLLGTNYTFSSYMTGGLETQLQAFLIVLSTYLLVRKEKYDGTSGRVYLCGASLVISLAIMTRLDSALICGVFCIFSMFALLKADVGANERLIRALCLSLPGLVVIGAWLTWKINYYGDILPNTYYVKGAGLSVVAVKRGIWYCWLFFANYCLIVVLLIGIFTANKSILQPKLRWLAISIGLWCLYVIKIGGDFMEFRFFVPVMPLLFVTIASIIAKLNDRAVQAALVGSILIASCYHALNFVGQRGIESVTELNDNVMPERRAWGKIGIELGKLFGNSNEPVVAATTAAGAIPYYSELPTIDMLGLNDKWIAKNGVYLGTRVAHSRCATLDYLIQAKVNLVIGHPQLVASSTPHNDDPQSYLYWPDDVSNLPSAAKIVEVPIDSGRRLDVLYLKPHAYVDEVIKREGLVTHDLP